MSYESVFFKNLVGGTLTELTKGGFVSFGSPHSIRISENSTPALEPPVSPSSHQEWDNSRFRHWWWNEFDSGADHAEFDAGSAESAQELLPILRDLTWPDFGVRVHGSILRLDRVREKHYERRVLPEIFLLAVMTILSGLSTYLKKGLLRSSLRGLLPPRGA